MDIVTVEGE